MLNNFRSHIQNFGKILGCKCTRFWEIITNAAVLLLSVINATGVKLVKKLQFILLLILLLVCLDFMVGSFVHTVIGKPPHYFFHLNFIIFILKEWIRRMVGRQHT